MDGLGAGVRFFSQTLLSDATCGKPGTDSSAKNPGGASVPKPPQSSAAEPLMDAIITAAALVVPGLDKVEDLDQWGSFAKRLFQTHVTLYVVPPEVSHSALSKVISDSHFGKLKGESGKCVLINYDPANAGEPVTRPEIRVAPLRDAGGHANTMVKGAIGARSSDGELVSGDLYLMWDAKRHGNEAALLKPFSKAGEKVMTKERQTVYVIYEEASLSARRAAVRGMASIQQVEFVHIVSKGIIEGEERKRTHYAGTTHGDTLGPVTLPDPKSLWQMPFGDKKKLYGHARMDVGGPTPGAEGSQAPQRFADTLEPVGYHTKPEQLYEELDTAYGAKGWLDLTALDETIALMCIKKRKPYFGCVLTQFHLEALTHRIMAKIMELFTVESSGITQPELIAKLPAFKQLKNKTPPKPGVKTTPSKKQRRSRVAKTAAQQKADLKKRLSKLGGDDDDAEEPEAEDGDDDEEEPENSGEDE